MRLDERHMNGGFRAGSGIQEQIGHEIEAPGVPKAPPDKPDRYQSKARNRLIAGFCLCRRHSSCAILPFFNCHGPGRRATQFKHPRWQKRTDVSHRRTLVILVESPG
jgi:hypothetical protein